MFKLLNVKESTMTRFLQLKNVETGTVEKCFDDSELKSNENFEFMQIGENYNCKIELFGKFSKEKTNSNVEVKIINPTVAIGKKIMMEVQVGKDIYYIPQWETSKISMDGRLFFDYTRKDLIQVDNVIHADLLR